MIRDSEIYKNSIKAAAEEISADRGTFLVTGATGMIGTCVVDVLQEANRSFGKGFTGYAMGRSREKLLSRFGSFPGIRCVVRDMAEEIELEKVDYIIHAASNADPVSYARYPAETMLTNILGAKNVLDFCRKANARALLTSSFEIYGKSDRSEFAESDYGTIDLDRIRSCYPVSKAAAETLFRAYCDEYGVDCVIARLPSVYGPTMQENDSKAHAQFLRNAVAGQDIVMKSRGEQKRTYCYVMDAVSGLLAVLFRGKPGEAYNIAGERSTASIAEIARTVASLTGRKVIFGEPNEAEGKGFSRPQDCVLDPTKIKALGWECRYDVRSGLEETIRILREK